MNEPYQVEIGHAEHRRLDRLMPDRIPAAIIEFVTRDLAERPAHLSTPLGGVLVGLRSACRGDYRVLLEVDEAERTIVVVRVAHRADAYTLRLRWS